MEAVNVIQRLHQHRAWVNGNLMTAARGLSDEQLHSTFQIGQGSIWKSLVHLYAAEFVWLEALLGNDEGIVPGDLPGKIPGNQLGEGGITGFDDLRLKWSELDQRWAEYLTTLTASSLGGTRLSENLEYRGSFRDSPKRRAAACLHARSLHHGSSRQHASSCWR